MDLYEKALLIAVKAHAGQKRWNGDPYVTHPIRVAARLPRNPEDLKIIALLHDVLEDTNYSPKDILNTFGNNIFQALEALTRKDKETYSNFIHRVSQNKLAIKVKLADLEDNLSDLDEEHPLRERYLKAKSILLQADASR